jgi:hypothetical protein
VFFFKKKKHKKAEEKTVKETVTETQKESTETNLDPNMKTSKQSNDKNEKYHISQNKDDQSEFFKQWRVRKEGSNKTIKYFKTQKEAIDYAETLAKNAGSSIVIHKVDGTIRKQDYSK